MTSPLSDLFQVPIDRRDPRWYDTFYAQVVTESFIRGIPAVMTGPDQFPYRILLTPQTEALSQAVPLKDVIEEATIQGTGIVLNPRGNGADWVFTYGNLWSYRAFGAFFVPVERSFESGSVTLKKDTSLLVGAPSEMFFPSYARRVIGAYLREVLKIAEPGIALLGPIGGAPASFAFSIFPEDFASQEAYQEAMQRMTWFLPSHYVITGLPKSQKISYTSLP